MWQDTNPYKQQLDIKERSEIKQSDKKTFSPLGYCIYEGPNNYVFH